jgi:hypothetical protein
VAQVLLRLGQLPLGVAAQLFALLRSLLQEQATQHQQDAQLFTLKLSVVVLLVVQPEMVVGLVDMVPDTLLSQPAQHILTPLVLVAQVPTVLLVVILHSQFPQLH